MLSCNCLISSCSQNDYFVKKRPKCILAKVLHISPINNDGRSHPTHSRCRPCRIHDTTVDSFCWFFSSGCPLHTHASLQPEHYAKVILLWWAMQMSHKKNMRDTLHPALPSFVLFGIFWVANPWLSRLSNVNMIWFRAFQINQVQPVEGTAFFQTK